MRESILVIFHAIRSLSFKKILKLFQIVLSNPIFALLTFHATTKAFVLAKKLYPSSLSTSGVGNAFRHALWCCLIMMYCCKISSPKKALIWCKKITDMHEELFPNNSNERLMDLHNNQVGIALFMEMLEGIHRQFFETSFFVEKLQEKVKTAVQLSSVKEIPDNELVYLW